MSKTKKSWVGDEWELSEDVPAHARPMNEGVTLTEYHRHKDGLGWVARYEQKYPADKASYRVGRFTHLSKSGAYEIINHRSYEVRINYEIGWGKRADAVRYARLMAEQMRHTRKFATPQGQKLAVLLVERSEELRRIAQGQRSGAVKTYEAIATDSLLSLAIELDVAGYMYHAKHYLPSYEKDDDFLSFKPYNAEQYALRIEEARWMLLPKEPTTHPKISPRAYVGCRGYSNRANLDLLADSLWIAGLEVVEGAPNASQKLVIHHLMDNCRNLGERATVKPHGLWPVQPSVLYNLGKNKDFNPSQLGVVEARPAPTKAQRVEAVRAWLSYGMVFPDPDPNPRGYGDNSYASYATDTSTKAPALERAEVAEIMRELGITWANPDKPEAALSDLAGKLACWMGEWGLEPGLRGEVMPYAQILAHYQAWQAKVLELQVGRYNDWLLPPDLSGAPWRLYYGLQLFGVKAKSEGMMLARIKGFRVRGVGGLGCGRPQLTFPLPKLSDVHGFRPELMTPPAPTPNPLHAKLREFSHTLSGEARVLAQRAASHAEAIVLARLAQQKLLTLGNKRLAAKVGAFAQGIQDASK